MRPGWIVFLALLTACAEPVASGDPEFTLVTDEVWGGGDLVVAARGFASLRGAFLLIGGDTLEPESVEGGLATFRAPERSGHYPVQLEWSGRQRAIGSVTVRGFTEVATSPAFSGYVLPWPRGAPVPTFLADGQDRLVLVDLRYGVVRTYPDSMHDVRCLRGAGASLDPAAAVLHPWSTSGSGCGWLQARRLTGDQDVLDSLDRSGVTRTAVWVKPGGWLLALHHWVDVISGGVFTATYRVEETNGFRISPRGDRIVALTAYASEGMLVFDTAGPSLAYVVESVTGLGGAAFSLEGDTLFLAGEDQADQPILAALDASDGTVLDSVAPEYWPWDLWLDPHGPWLVSVGVRQREDAWHVQRPVVEVIDRRNLRRVAVFGPPEEEGCIPEFCGDLYLVPYLAGRELYVTQIRYRESGAAPARIFRFELLRSGP